MKQITVALLALILAATACSSSPATSPMASKPMAQESAIPKASPTLNRPSASGILPAIEDFISQHPEYGTIKEVTAMPDWASGKRQQIRTDSGSYLFYVYESEVVGVDKYSISGEREKIYHKDTPTPIVNAQRPASSDLPGYVVLFKTIDLKNNLGDVLIESYSRNTSASVRETTFKAIAEKEGFTHGALYSTTDAYKADDSTSFLKSHPNAIREGFLGSLEESGLFTPAEVLYP